MNLKRLLLMPLLFMSISVSCLAETRADNGLLVSIRTNRVQKMGFKSINLEEDSSSSQPTQHLTDNTARVDPLDHLKKYRGGYNISNKHYWSSTAFTGKSGYIIGVGWLLGGLGYAIFLLSTAFCCKDWRCSINWSGWSKEHYFWSLISALLLAFLIIIVTGVILGGSSRFFSRSHTIKNIVVDTANNATDTIYSTTAALRDVEESARPFGAYGRGLNSTANQLDQQANKIQKDARKNKRRVLKGLTSIYAITTVLIALNLVSVLALLASGFLRITRIFYVVLVISWGFTAFFWVGFGLYYFLGKFAGDTCIALEQYQQDPGRSSLSSVLPCNDLHSAQPALRDARAQMHDLINEINANISAQTKYPLLRQVRICNPFTGPPDYQYQPQSCPSNTIQIGQIPQLLKGFTCSAYGVCGTRQFISPNLFNQTSAYATSVQALFDALPNMESLANCDPVYRAVNEIRLSQCGPVRKDIHMVWAATVVLSIFMMFLISICVAKDYSDHYHNRTRHNSTGSINPHCTPPHITNTDVNTEQVINF